MAVIFSLMLCSCNTRNAVSHIPKLEEDKPRKLLVFLDGTSNNEESHTNISKLYNLVTLQDKPAMNAIYLRGVGNGADVVGMAFGSGIRKEVCKAYLFLAETYDQDRGDEIYLFGFSRGAYAARMLAGFIHSAGLVDLKQIEKSDRQDFVRKMFDAHKGQKSLDQRRADVRKVSGQDAALQEVKIEFMGLWDTVASLGLPDYDDNYYVPETKFLDQLCNVKRASQALSLNDNRGSVFTPALLTHGILVENCKEVNLDEVVNEVWFFGAHSDVGGGYFNSYLSGVSLNWMIREIEEFDLLPPNTSVYEDRFGETNDPRKGFSKLIYTDKSRKLVYFASRDGFRDEKLKIHRSVLERLEYRVKTNEINLLAFFGDCFFLNTKGGYTYKQDAACFEVVE
ncbi:T6SS phospholipase effector Tle1-like catalytic domain-containing protein [Aureitalea marina]|nr:DUF2235 domain-containing protein [Aureitalea marina]